MVAVSQEHIAVTPGVCGGQPRIAGHRVRVLDIVVATEEQGLSPDEVVAAYPGLTLADVHAALAYYFDHRQEIRQAIAEERRLAQEIQARTPSRMAEKLGHPRAR